MAYVLSQLVKLHYYFNDECSDPRVQDWPLMSSPFPSMAIILLYLAFVLKWGPNFMKDRKPFQLDNLIRFYNLVQVAVCGFLVFEAFYLCYFRDYSLICQPVNYTTNYWAVRIASRVYLYYNLKILDLLDTVFFVLRKKQNQVTFLHVYHHGGMVMLTWIGSKYFAGGHGVFMGSINSFVHVVMYSYYFLTSLSAKYKENVWWKKYITQLQIIQFFLIITHWMLIVFQPNCDYPKWPVILLVPQNLFMLIMFVDFYFKAYIKKRVPKPIVQKTDDIISSTNGKNGINEMTINNDIKTKTQKKVENLPVQTSKLELNGKSKKK